MVFGVDYLLNSCLIIIILLEKEMPNHLLRQFGICGAPFFHPPTYPRWQPQWVLSDKIMIIAS
jgi:hypothetical protein